MFAASKMKQIEMGKRCSLLTSTKVKHSAELSEKSTKLTAIHKAIDLLERISERNENENDPTFVEGNNKSNNWWKTNRRKDLRELAQQKLPLNSVNSLVKCESVVWLETGTKDFDQTMQLLKALKALNELVCIELDNQSETRAFLSRNSQELIVTALNSFYSSHNYQLVKRNDDHLIRRRIQIDNEVLCSIWEAFEHNEFALKALVDQMEDEGDSDRMQARQAWWKTLKSASALLQHELYALVVRLSDIEAEISSQEQNMRGQIDRLLLDPRNYTIITLPTGNH